MIQKTLFTILLTIFSLNASEDFLLEEDFLQSLEEVSEIATKTKLNIDNTPSFVTVLHSDKLKKLGLVNVFQALNLVPGVQLKKELSGVAAITFRGVSQKGEVKLMIDGVVINNTYRGSIYHYLDFPIEAVERIEIIRGAGSVLYGSNAISGVINIITYNSQRESTNKLFISQGNFGNHQIGTVVSTYIDDIKIAMDAYYHKNDKTISIEPNLSTQVGDSDRHLKDYTVGINISDEHFSFLGRVKKSDIGNAYGVFSVLDDGIDKYNNENNSIFAQLSYTNSINKNNKIIALVGYNQYRQYAQVSHPRITTIDTVYKEKSYFLETDLISTSLNNNELLIGVKFESAKTIESQWSAGKEYLSDPSLYRKTTSLYLNDNYSATSKFDISAGIRYDHYSDFGDAYSPNLGLVYRLNEEIIFKALYSHAFRAPSWVELTSNQQLESEHSNSIETGVIFKKNQQNILRVNFYASELEDMIAKDSRGKYIQNSKNNFYGSEIEYIYLPNNHTEINFLASYINAQDENGNDLADIANILSSTSITYELNSGFTFGSLLRYVSSSKRSDSDIRDNKDESFIFDQTISYSYKNFTTTLIIKDLFNAGTYYALPKNRYGEDFYDEGRSILLNASLEF